MHSRCAGGSGLMNLMAHEFSRDPSLGAVQFTSAVLERSHHLFNHLIKEHRGQLGVQNRAELEGYLEEKKKKETHK